MDYKGRENHVLVMHVEPGMQVHANQADEVFKRVGDMSFGDYEALLCLT